MSRLPIFAGAKRAVVLGSFITLAAYTVIMFCNNLQVRTIAFAFMGLGMVVKNAFSFEWLVGCVPTQNKTDCTTCINCVDAVPMAVFCLYVAYVDKDWQGINLVSLYVCWLAFILACFFPESPKYLLNESRREEAIAALNYMAWINGSNNRIPETAQFVEDRGIFVKTEEE